MPKLFHYLTICSFFIFSTAADAQISGTIFNDVNGITDNTVNGTGSNAGGINAVLVNVTTGNVAATTTVAANGTYSFAAVTSANYNVLITTNTATVGNLPPAVALPANWVVTGEYLGTGTGSDGTPDGVLPLGTTAAVTNANFGIEQLPNTNTTTASAQPNPGGTGAVTLLATDFGGTDPDGGTIDSIHIPSFPTNTTTLGINAVNYTSVTFPAGGLKVPTNAAGQPTQAITLDPVNGGINAVITYAAMDNARKSDATPGSLTVPFTDSISGKVFNDINGLVGAPLNTVDGTGTNAGGLNAVLVNTITGNVISFTPVAANGTYYLNVPDGSYAVWITTNTPVINNPPPAVVLPANWVNTGENLGTAAGSDGTVDGVLALPLITGNVINANFGIEQLPNTNIDTAALQPDPGGTTAVAVPANSFGGTDPNGGDMDSLRITTFPGNTATITINGVPYTNLTWPAQGVTVPTNNAGQPSWAISIDPEGPGYVTIIYAEIDNANKADATPGSRTLVFGGMAVVDNQTALQLAQNLTGTGVVVLNQTLNCSGVANGIFNIIGVPAALNNLGLDSGIVLTSGWAKTTGAPPNIGVNGPQVNAGPDHQLNLPGDVDLNTVLMGITTNDACRLEFDFVPAGDTVKFDYVFASTEYQIYSCSQWNDAFGFFISGPGYATPLNIAKIPGTNIPICVNSTSGITTGPLCTQMGPGSPFAQYYVNNTGGGLVTYQGFTTVFTAVAAVTPCDTFHLKLAIGDGSDWALDSGVFLKAGSLSSTALAVHTYGGGGLERPFTNTVRGCPPGVIRVSRNGGLNQPITIPVTYTGTAVNGVDYDPLPTSVVIPAGDSVVTLNISGIPVSPATGPKSAIISIISPYTCGNGDPIILSSDTIMIYDSIYVNIPTPDTAICRDKHVDITADADTFLNIAWTPAATVSDPTGLNVTLTPTQPTDYTLTVMIPGSLGTGCTASTAHIFVDVKDTPMVDLGPDKVTCGTGVQLNASTTPLNDDETFSWTPVTNLNDPEIRHPFASPTTTTQYIVKVNPGAVGCDGFDSITIRILPDHINVLNTDSVVCAGSQVVLRADADTNFNFNWTPEPDIVNPLAANTILNAQTSGYYTLTASYPGCLPMPDSFYLEVQPVPRVNIGTDRYICSYDTIQFIGSVVPSNYNNYTFDWTPGMDLDDSTVQHPVFSGDNYVPEMTLKVTTPIGCTGSDTMMIVVYPGDFLTASTDTGTCPPAMIQLTSSGAATYSWSPSYGLDATDIPNPIASPVTSTDYTLLGSKTYNGHVCYDTQRVAVNVYPAASLNLPDSIQLWPGESYQMDPEGNGLYYTWFPPSGLTAANISNPVANPEVRTRYFVTSTTEHGCIVKDSIDILINTETALDAPNAFSPSTGVFKIVKRGIATLQYFRIYNRWGNKVFETTDIDAGWDGTYNDKPQPMGVYVYTIEAISSTGKPFKKNGTVTLLR
jgi:gliding motility-associated-like protein